MAAQAFLYGGMAGLQLVGGYYASQNIKESARINREVADLNAKYAELEAYDMEIEGISRVAEYQNVIDSIESDQRTALAAADVDINSGSVAAVVAEDKFIAEFNKMEILKTAEEAASGLEDAAVEFRRQGILGQAAGSRQAGEVLFQSTLQAANTGLTGYSRSR